MATHRPSSKGKAPARNASRAAALANPVFLLKGTYGYAYTALWHAVPRYGAPVPTLLAAVESPPSGGTTGAFVQVPGYGITSYAGFVHFDGSGHLVAAGCNGRGGIDWSYDTLTGSYTLAPNSLVPGPLFEGTFTTTVPGGVSILHYFVATDGFRKLHFMIRETSNASGAPSRQPVAAGVLVRT